MTTPAEHAAQLREMAKWAGEQVDRDTLTAAADFLDSLTVQDYTNAWVYYVGPREEA